MTGRQRACAVCARMLDYFQATDGGESGWQHGFVDSPADHLAVPVEPGQIHTRGRCDFCSAESPTWMIPARDFHAVGASYSDGGWGACEACKTLVDGDRWNTLIARVMTACDLPPDAVTHLRRLYRALRANITGAPTPLEDSE